MSSLPSRFELGAGGMLPAPVRLKPKQPPGGTSLLRGDRDPFHRPTFHHPVPSNPSLQSSVTAGSKRRESDADDEEVFSMDIDEPSGGSQPSPALPAAAQAKQQSPRLVAAAPIPGRSSSGPPTMRSSLSGPSSRTMDAPLPPRAKSHEIKPAPSITKKPRRSTSVSTSERGAISLPNTPMFGPSATPRGTPLLGPLAPPASPSLSGLSAMGSPTMSGLSGTSPLVPIDADLQPQAMTRSHEFKEGRRVFHVHFGHGFVKSLEAEPAASDTDKAPPQPEAQRVLTQRTHNIHIHFDNPKYKAGMRLRAFYAVPKMVVIPSTAALRKQKLLQAVNATPASLPQRLALVRTLQAAGSVRAACALVSRWKLQSHFEPSQLLERLLAARCYSSAVRFAREFGLLGAFPLQQLYKKMLDERHYEGPLKHAGATQTSLDGEHTPADVVQLLVDAGGFAVALKYVHKFGLSPRFPPSELVARCLQAPGELTVRTCGLLLKYVKVFGLEGAFPIASLLERIGASGVTVHDLGGRYILKGRRRQAISTPGAGGSQTGSLGGSAGGTPGTSPPTGSSVPLGSSAPAAS